MEQVGVFWDLENCYAPATRNGSPSEQIMGTGAVAANVLEFARSYGKVTCCNAYTDSTLLTTGNVRSLHEAGVTLVHVPNRAKEAADKAMIVDLCFFAVENKAPATLIVITGDRDFANTLQKLQLYGYKVVVVSPYQNGAVPTALHCAASDRQVFDWAHLAKRGVASEPATPPPPPSQPPATAHSGTAQSRAYNPLLHANSSQQSYVIDSASPTWQQQQHQWQPQQQFSPPEQTPKSQQHAARAPVANPSNLNFPAGCARALTDFWRSCSGHPVQHPYSPLVSFLNQHRACGGYRVWGYTKLMHFLKDAQAAGLLWLRPGQVINQLTGQPFPEVAPAALKDYRNPCHVLYWLALGFAQEEAQELVYLAGQKEWGHPIVGRLARTSPHFDPELHSQTYCSMLGREAFPSKTPSHNPKSAVQSAAPPPLVLQHMEDCANSFLTSQPQTQSSTAAVEWGLGALSFSVDFPVDGTNVGGLAGMAQPDTWRSTPGVYNLPKCLDDDTGFFAPLYPPYKAGGQPAVAFSPGETVLSSLLC